MRPPNSLQNKAQSVPTGNGPAPLLLSCRFVTLPSSLCLQHLNRVPASGPLHLPPLQSEYSSSRSLRSTLPLFKKKKNPFLLMPLPCKGAGWGWGVSTGSAFARRAIRFLRRSAQLPGCRLGLRSCSSRTFPPAPRLFCRSVPVAMRTVLVSPARRASPLRS